MKSVWRALAWIGIASVLGPGSSIPNDFDALFQIGGLALTLVGTFGMVLAGRPSVPHYDNDD